MNSPERGRVWRGGPSCPGYPHLGWGRRSSWRRRRASWAGSTWSCSATCAASEPSRTRSRCSCLVMHASDGKLITHGFDGNVAVHNAKAKLAWASSECPLRLLWKWFHVVFILRVISMAVLPQSCSALYAYVCSCKHFMWVSLHNYIKRSIPIPQASSFLLIFFSSRLFESLNLFWS